MTPIEKLDSLIEAMEYTFIEEGGDIYGWIGSFKEFRNMLHDSNLEKQKQEIIDTLEDPAYQNPGPEGGWIWCWNEDDIEEVKELIKKL